MAGLTLLSPAIASAGAWTQPKGQGQAIVKYEVMEADRGFNTDEDEVDLPAERQDRALSLFSEYGLTERLTVQLKAEWQEGKDGFVSYDGRGPVEIGLTWQLHRSDRNAVSLYGGYTRAGNGRNAGYAAPGVGEHDWEVRLAAGRSLKPVERLSPLAPFVELQVARRMRTGLPDETRIDATAGTRIGRDWLLLGQAFAGSADGGARWLSLETGVVREFGPWSAQIAWRQTVAGRETPVSSGPVIGLWRRF